MGKSLKAFLILGGLFAAVWIIGRLTNTLQLFSASTSANQPAIHAGDKFVASGLKKPNQFDFICNFQDETQFGNQIWIHRLCGMEGDKIEIRNRELFVNNENTDKNLMLSHNYFISSKDLDVIKSIIKLDENFIQQISADTLVFPLSDEIVRNNNIKATRQVLPKSYKDDFIDKTFSNKNWNQDNFGPITVPIGKYFVLGDNRHYSQDSGYIGFIDKKNYVATVIGRK